jgi:hypothetical protein
MYSREFVKSNKTLFYTSLGKYMSKNKSKYKSKNKWLNYSTNVKAVYLRLNTTNKLASVNIDIQHRDNDIQELFFDQFNELKVVFTSILGNNWQWNSKYINESLISCSRISIELKGVNIYEKKTWPDIFKFYETQLIKFDQFWFEFNEIFKQLED